MKTQFQSLTAFAEEVERIEKTKNDYLVPSIRMGMEDDDLLFFPAGEFVASEFGITDYAHGQIADKLGIPRKYYDKMQEVPGLRTHNVNKWLQHQPTAKMVRTLDGKVRAFLSDSFKPLDNHDILQQSIFPVLEPYKNDLKVTALNLSETKMYMQLVFKSLSTEIKVGDVVNYGITISNSEVGAGSLNVESFIYRLVCSNGMVRNSLFKKYHVGRRIEEDENSNIWQSDTLQKELEGYQLRLRDVLKKSLTFENLMLETESMRVATGDVITNITKTVENVTKRFGLSDNQGNGIIQNMVNGNDSTRWGLANGITALAHNLENPDSQYQMEKLGSQIIDLSPSEWKFVNAS